jgi:hypothetical protein
MTDTPFNKVAVGNKQFIVAWHLTAGGSGVLGEAFEAIDCELVSVYASMHPDLDCRLHQSNLDDVPPNLGTAVTTELQNNIVIAPPLSATRWYWPSIIAGDLSGVVSLLFREL